MGDPSDGPSSLRALGDRLFAILALAIASPLLLALMAWIRVVDGAPVVHRDLRAGRGEVPFWLFKLRTLRPDDDAGRRIAPEDDARLTHTGRVLRRWRLDELPQLVNILRGDIRLVGPRPLPPEHVDALPPTLREATRALTPGLTDPAALAFLAEDAVLAGRPDPEADYLKHILPAKVAMALDYEHTRTPWSDLAVIARTPILTLSRRHRRRSEKALRALLANSKGVKSTQQPPCDGPSGG